MKKRTMMMLCTAVLTLVLTAVPATASAGPFSPIEVEAYSFIEGWMFINKKIHEPMITPEYPCASCEYLPFCNTCPADSQREYGSPQIVNPNQCALAKLRYNTFSGKEEFVYGI